MGYKGLTYFEWENIWDFRQGKVLGPGLFYLQVLRTRWEACIAMFLMWDKGERFILAPKWTRLPVPLLIECPTHTAQNTRLFWPNVSISLVYFMIAYFHSGRLRAASQTPSTTAADWMSHSHSSKSALWIGKPPSNSRGGHLGIALLAFAPPHPHSNGHSGASKTWVDSPAK